jgi:uncharacterized membrane protein YjgN (DUF898 family)
MEQATSSGIEPHPMEFSGGGGEFFRVWIVNLLLKIVTLGFYTPFARRRTAQYFYNHTLIGGSPLEFTAQQRKMVLGFLLLVGLYLAFRIASDTGQGTVVTILLFAAAGLSPYFWASAMRFRLASTRWRGVRPQFIASWGQVYRAGWPVFALAACWAGVAAIIEIELLAAGAPRIALVAGALVPTLMCIIRLEYNYKALLVSRTFIGGQSGRWKPQYGDFVRIWMLTLAIFVGSLLLVVAVLVGAGLGAAALGSAGPKGMMKALAAVALGVALIFLLFLVSAPARAYREARIFRLVWNNVGVSHIARFRCNLRVRAYVLLRIKNIFLTLVTLGFYRPFATVSEYRMKTQSVTLHVKGGLDQLAGQLVQQQDGLGDAIADAVGLDLIG